jgi:hypothetical protein
MKEINIKVKSSDKIISLNNVECGKCFVGNTNLNGGYGCIFGDKEDGFKCYHWNCPFAYTANLFDIRKLEPDSFDEVAEGFGLNPKKAIKFSDEELQKYDTSYYTDEYMRQYYEVVEIEMDSEELEEFRDKIREVDDDTIDTISELYKFNIVEVE